MSRANNHVAVAAAAAGTPSYFCPTSRKFRHLFHQKDILKISTQDAYTHLEGNIIILVNRSASLQHIFWRSVFSLLVRQRCLSCGHRNAKKKRRRGAREPNPLLSPKCVKKKSKKTRTVSGKDLRHSVRVSGSLRLLCSHTACGHEKKNDHRALPQAKKIN